MKRHNYRQMKSVTEAREIFLSRFDLNAMLPPEEISTMAARGRVTAAPVWAGRSSPATHQAAMDGFAVFAASTFWATPDQPKSLAVGEKAFPINAGQMMPRGTDVVIIAENVPNLEADCAFRPNRPRVPGEVGRLIRSKAAARSGEIRPLF